MLQYSLSGYLRRYFLLVCGLVIMAVGVVLSINAHIGISPISCLPYVLNQVCSTLTVGQFTAAMHLVFVLFQILLLRKQYSYYQLLQLVVAVALGFLIDVAMVVLVFLQPANYLEQWLLLSASTVFVSFGMFLEVKAGVLMVAGEGFVKAIATVTRIEFSKIKIATDCSLVAISLAIGLTCAHQVLGIREGTLFSAIFVGTILRFFAKHFHLVDYFLRSEICADQKQVCK